MTRFAHLTDLHVTAPGIDDPHLHSDTVATLDLAVERLRTIEPPLDFVAISGDLTNHGDADSYRHLKAAIAALDMPVILSLGNHDTRSGFRAVFAPDANPDTPVFHRSVQGGLHVIALDSSVPGRVGGAIDAAQFAALDAALGDHAELPKLILCHHPPRPDSGAALNWESLTEEDSARLAATLQGHKVAAILSGHVHYNRVTLWHGIPVVVSNGLHATIDVLEREGMVIEEGTGFALCEITPSGLGVSFVPLLPARRVLGRIAGDILRGFS